MLNMNLQFFAHKKGVGSTKNGRDSESKRLGAKRADGQFVKAGNYDLSVYLHKKVREMPHYEKFTLQKDIRECIDGIMDEIEAYERSKTISHLYTADRLKGRLVRKIRLAHDLKYSAMNDRVYKYCATQIGILGAYIGGLINKAQKEKKSK